MSRRQYSIGGRADHKVELMGGGELRTGTRKWHLTSRGMHCCGWRHADPLPPSLFPSPSLSCPFPHCLSSLRSCLPPLLSWNRLIHTGLCSREGKSQVYYSPEILLMFTVRIWRRVSNCSNLLYVKGIVRVKVWEKRNLLHLATMFDLLRFQHYFIIKRKLGLSSGGVAA